jgi:hypothetical protein
VLQPRSESRTAWPLCAPDASKHTNPSAVRSATLWLKLSTIAMPSATSLSSFVTRFTGWSACPLSMMRAEMSRRSAMPPTVIRAPAQSWR